MRVSRVARAGLGVAVVATLLAGCATGEQDAAGTATATPAASATGVSASGTAGTSPSPDSSSPAAASTRSASASPRPTRTPGSKLEEAAAAVLVGLRDGDYKELSQVAAADGVRFSPWAYIDVEGDVTLTPAEIAGLAQDRKKYLWGAEAGSGDVIKTTWAKYNDRFGYSHDFLAADEVTENGIVDAGSTTNNIEQAYPGAKYVDYHMKGVDPDFGGLDWASLRVVLVPEDGKYRWVGLVHDEWTP